MTKKRKTNKMTEQNKNKRTHRILGRIKNKAKSIENLNQLTKQHCNGYPQVKAKNLERCMK